MLTYIAVLMAQPITDSMLAEADQAARDWMATEYTDCGTLSWEMLRPHPDSIARYVARYPGMVDAMEVAVWGTPPAGFVPFRNTQPLRNQLRTLFGGQPKDYVVVFEHDDGAGED